jgi:regulator of protease activity HflC (stomatin/prohibitin superfamily)
MSTASASAEPRRSSFADKELEAVNGYLMIAIGVVLIAVCAWLTYLGYDDDGHALPKAWFSMIAIIVIAIVIAKGLVILQPNESVVCLLFGSYVGTEHRSGLWWVNPLNSKTKVTRRLETLEAGPLKVNDAVGNPIDIGAVVVWRVEDAAKALLEVGSYTNYVKAQSETALRRMASEHPYDEVEAEEAIAQGETPMTATHRPDGGAMPMSSVTLRDGGDAIIETLLKEIRTRMEPIGVSVVEARISHLAYSSEIASSMLRKQAASAVVAARRMVVRGAVSIVEDALRELDEKKLADALDPERKAAMISNLLVVLVSDREVTPVINTGTLYS